MKKWFRNLIVNIVLEEIEIGGNCGLCGTWVDDCLAPKCWPYVVCDECAMLPDEEFDRLAIQSIHARGKTT
jgi:hypothetical protein